jgi:hypothetical protein
VRVAGDDPAPTDHDFAFERRRIETGRRHDNDVRTLSGLEYCTPLDFRRRHESINVEAAFK